MYNALYGTNMYSKSDFKKMKKQERQLYYLLNFCVKEAFNNKLIDLHNLIISEINSAESELDKNGDYPLNIGVFEQIDKISKIMTDKGFQKFESCVEQYIKELFPE